MTTFDITDAFLEHLVQRGIVCMAWTQVYDPAGSVVLSALSAAIPLMVLFYMLAIRRAKGHVAAIVGLAVAFVLAVALWGMPFGTAVSSVAYGMANGLFPIVWIVITAVWVYNMTVESGEFEIIKDSLARLTDDRRLQALFIAFAFGAFLEGTAGFGTPVAITAAMLAGIGFNPLYAAGLCLIANTAPVAFGAIGVPVIVAGHPVGGNRPRGRRFRQVSRADRTRLAPCGYFAFRTRGQGRVCACEIPGRHPYGRGLRAFGRAHLSGGMPARGKKLRTGRRLPHKMVLAGAG